MGLRIYRLGYDSFWCDEVFSLIRYQNNSILKIIDASYSNVHPPLYFIILHFFVIQPGDIETLARLPSVIFGTITVIPLYFMAKKFFNDEVAVVGTLIYAISITGIAYSREARMYTMALFFCTVAMYYFYRALKNNRTFDWSIFSLSAILSLYTLYYTAIFISTLVLFGLVDILIRSATRQPGASRVLKSFIISLAVIFIAISPQLPIMYHQSSSSEAISGPHPTNLSFFPDILYFLSGKEIGIYHYFAFAIASGALCLFGIVMGIRKKFNITSYHVWIIIVFSLVSFILTYKIKFYDRYAIYLMIPYLMLVANGIVETAGLSRYVISLVKQVCGWDIKYKKIYEAIPVLIALSLILVIIASSIGSLYDGTLNINLRDAIQYVKDNGGPTDHMMIINADLYARDYYVNLLGVEDRNIEFSGNYDNVKSSHDIKWIIISDYVDLDSVSAYYGKDCPVDYSIKQWLDQNMHYCANFGRLSVYESY